MTYVFNHAQHLGLDRVAALYNMARDRGLADAIFYDGHISSWRDWVEYLRATPSWLIHCANGQGETAAFFWINGILGRSGAFHFCTFVKGDEAVDLGRQALRWAFHHTKFDSFFGITPKPYRHVLRLMRGLGFRILGEIPGACYFASKKRYYPGMVSVITPEEVTV